MYRTIINAEADTAVKAVRSQRCSTPDLFRVIFTTVSDLLLQWVITPHQTAVGMTVPLTTSAA